MNDELFISFVPKVFHRFVCFLPRAAFCVRLSEFSESLLLAFQSNLVSFCRSDVHKRFQISSQLLSIKPNILTFTLIVLKKPLRIVHKPQIVSLFNIV
jgi:hypothetical protein